MNTPREHSPGGSEEPTGGNQPVDSTPATPPDVQAPVRPQNAGAPRGLSALRDLGRFSERLTVAAILTITIWVAHFAQSAHFGLYEDDWAFIGQPMTWTLGHLKDYVWYTLQHWPQGRPIAFSAVALAAFLGTRIGGLEAVYLIAFALHVTNTLIVYAIVRRQLPAAPSLCAALGFCLFPSITSTPLAEAELFVGLTLFFLLFATWLYLRGWRFAAYVVSAGSLLTYENAFLPFFAVPLLESKLVPNLRRALLKHWAILVAIGSSLFWLRVNMGEEKTSTLLGNGLRATLERMAVAMYVGPLTTLRLFGKRLITVLRDGDRDAFLIVILLAAGFTVALYLMRASLSDKVEIWPVSLNSRWFRLKVSLSVDESTATALRLGACGCVMLVIGYALAITSGWYPPEVEDGRLTGSHLAASFGASLLFGATSAILLDLAASHRKKFWAALVLGFYFAGLAGFHHLVQDDFRKSWTIQRAFWAAVNKQCPDLTDGTVLIYEVESSPTRYIQTSSWGDPYVLSEVYNFPKTWKQPPQLFSTTTGWMGDVVVSDGQFFWQPQVPWPNTKLPQGNVILLRGAPDNPKRVFGSVRLQSKEFLLKSPEGASALAFPRGPLYQYVMQP